MKTTLLTLAFVASLLFSPAIAQHEDKVVSKILQDEWVSKYRKIKVDLENKAGNFKDMEGVSEKDFAVMKKSYMEVSARLNDWLKSFAKNCMLPETYQLMEQTGSPVNEMLKADLMDIISLYENTFNSRYEEITGLRQRNAIFSNAKLNKDANQHTALNVDYAKIEGDEVSKRIRKPLEVAHWKEL
jgi:hypothetical protein